MTVSAVLDFWFDPQVQAKWFIKSDLFDLEIRDKFYSAYLAGLRGELDHWQESLEGCLAWVILYDQFPRNMFRNHGQAFDTDPLALKVAQKAIDKFAWQSLDQIQQVMLCMPFMHSEDLGTQEQSLELFQKIGREKNMSYAKSHYEIIKRFGRFPFRNRALNRPSTPEEESYMAENSNF